MSSPPRKVLKSSENVVDTGHHHHHHHHHHHSRDARKPSPNAAAASAQTSSNKLEPPKPPRSAFMCFTDAKKREIMSSHGIVKDNDDILKIVAREWKALSDRDRAHWDEEARNDKVRFVREKAAYKGPWAIPKRRAKKHPLAPKRPMSAFLKYSQTRRAKVKEDNPDMSNTDVSRLLGEMWRNASPKERAPYVEQEERERAIYKEDIKKWRDDQARMDAASRTSHQTVQNYRHRPQPATTYERSYPSGSSSFENLHMDSFEEPQKKPAFRPLYGNTAYPTYRQGYNTHPPPPPPPGRLSSGLGNEKKRNQNWTYNTFQLTPQNAAPELSLQHSSDYHDMDSLQVPRPPLPPPQMEEDESMDGHYLPPRSSYFSENMGLGHHYSRYP